MRLLVVAICSALLLAACATQPTVTPVDRLPWGASPEAVQADQASEPVVATPDRQVYQGQFAGLAATLVYHFDDAALTEVVVLNRAQYSDRTRYIEDFNEVSTRLRNRYGQPEFEEMRWRDRLFADRPERYGDAISAGHLTYLARWDTPQLRLLMALRGERYQVLHELVLRPPTTGPDSP